MAGTGMGATGPFLIRMLTGKVGVLIQEGMNLFMANAPMRPPRKTAADVLSSAFDEEVLASKAGVMYLNRNARAESSKESRDEGKQERAWKGSLRLAGVKDGDTVLDLWE